MREGKGNRYSSRNNDDGTQADNKMFWNIFEQENESFESQLRKMEKAHRAIYDDVIAPGAKKSSTRISDHWAYRDLNEMLEDIYKRSGCVVLEMFLYAAKAVPGLLPSDSIDREPPQRDITNAYAQLLASWMNRSMNEYSERDRRNTSDNASIKGYIHILKSWPRTGTWNEIQRLAIRMYGEMKETSEEIEEVLFDALPQVYNYTSIFDVLLRAEATRGHSPKRLNTLLRFVCARRSDQSGIHCTEEMLERFTAAINSVYYDDNELYYSLRDCYLELKRGPAVKFLNKTFQIEETDPLKDFQDTSDLEKARYISGHFDPGDFGWRRWIENLDSKPLFQSVCNCFEKAIYPSGNVRHISLTLCAFAGMRRMEQGRSYVRRLNTDGGFHMQLDRPVEKCAFLCARLFAGVDIPVRDILETYEMVDPGELDEIKDTVKVIIRRSGNREEVRSYIQGLVEQTAPSDKTACRKLLELLDTYYHFNPKDPELQRDIIPFAPVLRLIEQYCGFDPVKGEFDSGGHYNMDICVMNYICDDITYLNKGKYKRFLQAACHTNMRGRASQLLVDYFSNDING